MKIKLVSAALLLALIPFAALAGNPLNIVIGTPGAGGGDPLYTAFGKINTAVNGVANCWAGTSAPSFSGSPQTYQCWWNTTGAPTAVVLNFFDGVSWDPAGTLNVTAHTFTPQGGATCTGDMTGTFPGCTLLTSVNSNVGAFGSAGVVPVVTVNNKGQVTAVSTASVSIPFTSVTGTTTCAQQPARTGDVTASAGSCADTIVAGAVTLAKQANLAANSIQGNNTGSPAAPAALTAGQAAIVIGAVTHAYEQTFTATGTYTPHAGMVFADVVCAGAGGGSGGVAASVNGATGGGGSGGWSHAILTAAQVTTDGGTEAVTIGTAGAAGLGTPTAGSNGTATSVGARCVANGGSGSSAGSVDGIGFPGGGGAVLAGAVGNDILPGIDGENGLAYNAANFPFWSGMGGYSPFGNPTTIVSCGYASTIKVQAAAVVGYGVGATGSVNCGKVTSIAGQSGAPGYVRIIEYSTQ